MCPVYPFSRGRVLAYALTREQLSKILDAGKYVVIWKRQDGQWKLHRDIWNSRQPAPKP